MTPEWLRAQLAAGMPALRGSAVSGTLVLNEELLNQLLADWLHSPGEGAARAGATPDVRQVLPFVKQLKVRAVAERLLIDFAIDVR